MTLWHGYDDRDRRARNSYEVSVFNPFDVLGDFDREFRRMNRELHRLERDYNRPGNQQQGQLSSLADRNMPMMPHIVVDNQGQRQAQFQFDTRGFQPEDITIRTENGNKLIITAKHEDKSDDHHHFREFRRMVAIPDGANLDNMQSRLSPQGVLTIQAPYSPPALQHDTDRVLPIEHGGSGGGNRNNTQQGSNSQQGQHGGQQNTKANQ